MSMTSDKEVVEHPLLLDDLILHENELTAEAKRQFSYHSEILRTFGLNRRSVLDNVKLTRIGRHLLLSSLNKLHTDCKQVLNYMAVHRELLDRSLPNVGPLVICGLPRTGSTLIYNLLACDPNCRAPLFTEMCVESLPPIARSNTAEHERRAASAISALQLRNQLIGRPSAVAASHACFDIEEDSFIWEQAGYSAELIFLRQKHQIEIDTWVYNDTNKHFVYDYHKTFLHMLNSVDAPASHWLLKSPEHALYLDTLLSHYPQTALVMTHRRLDEVLPSFCRLIWAFVGVNFDENDPASRAIVDTNSLQHIDEMIDRIIKFRTRPCRLYKAIFDVDYDDLMEQPIATVRRIYDHFELHWSHEFEVAMQTWLRDNPQGKQGRHTYSLAELGLTREDIEARYADYTNLFLRSSSSSQTIPNAAM